METSAIVTMVIGMVIIWGGLIASVYWAFRTRTRWGGGSSDEPDLREPER